MINEGEFYAVTLLSLSRFYESYQLFGIVKIVIIADNAFTVIYNAVLFVSFKAVKKLVNAVAFYE